MSVLSQGETTLFDMQASTENLEEAEMDPLNFRPNPEALVPKITANEGTNGDLGGIYKPPMLNPVSMEDDPDKDYNKKKRRAAEEKARRSGRSQIVSDFAREIQGAPDEVSFQIKRNLICRAFF